MSSDGQRDGNVETQSPYPYPHHYLLAFSGELSIKGKGTRQRFVDRLVRNLAEALREGQCSFDIERSWSRLIVHTADERAAQIAGNVFGVHSVRAIEPRSWETLDDILRQGEEILTSSVAGKTFAVKARRGEASQKVPFKSPDVERLLGSRLFAASVGVNLKHPQVQVLVEIHRQAVYFGLAPQEACGGLPAGCESRALVLLSGGFDSAVAAWSMLRRGVQLDYLFLNLGGEEHRDKVLQVAKVLADQWSYGLRPRLHMVDFRPVAEEIQRTCPQRLWQVVLKRQMLRVADQVARMGRCAAIITGEVVAQVSSQTLQNLAVIQTVTPIPILRPLAGESKDDIVGRARRIGVYELCAQVPEYCALAGKGPETHAKLERVEVAERGLDLDALSAAAEGRATFDLRALDLELLRSPGHEVDTIPAEAEVIDLRSFHAYRSWHYPAAQHMSYGDAVRQPEGFEADTTYVFYCEVGLKSAHLAELLSRQQIAQAYHVRGGLKQVLRLAEGDDPALAALRSPVLLD